MHLKHTIILNLLYKLSTIRVATFIETPPKKTKAQYKETGRPYRRHGIRIHILVEGLRLVDHKLKAAIPFRNTI